MNRKARRLAKKGSKKPARAAGKKSNSHIQEKFGQAVQAFQSGAYSQAAALTEDLLKTLPASADLYKLRGSIDFAQHNYDKALPFFEKGLAMDPGNPSLVDLVGTSNLELGNFKEAIVSFRRLILNDARNASAYNKLGAALLGAGEAHAAAKAFRDSLIYRPGDKSTRLNLIQALTEQGAREDALRVCREMIEADKSAIEGYQALGECQMKARDWEGALATANLALENGLSDAEIHTLKGYALGALLRFEEAETEIQRALELEPERPSALSALCILSFYQEKWPEGWRYYEARQQNPSYISRPFSQPRWKGEPLEGKKILVWGEQGVGDEIQFGSMLPDFMKMANNAVFEMDGRLVPLFQRSFPQMECVARTDPPAKQLMGDDIDFQIPSGSLGQYLRPDSASFGTGAPYLRADPDRVKQFKTRYGGDEKKFNVGIAWYSTKEGGLSKSIPLVSLAPLFDVSTVQFIDLQYGDTEAERAAFSAQTGFSLLHDETVDQMESIEDFAAQIAALDLVISISNSTVHIAGALGIPTWVILSAAPLQQWQLNRRDSPWYSSVELFRQRRENDLEYVVSEIRERLENLV